MLMIRDSMLTWFQERTSLEDRARDPDIHRMLCGRRPAEADFIFGSEGIQLVDFDDSMMCIYYESSVSCI